MQTLIKKPPSQFYFLRDKVEQEIAGSIVSFGEKTKLRDACEYALLSGGKRFRPIIVLMIAEALGHGLNASFAALSVEYFHTASLIADDLPCMDNDDERRNKPSVHRVYGEAIALLASYSLICAAFQKIHQNSEMMRQAPPPFSHYSDQACRVALESATHCAGILGATGGQFLDIFPPNQNLETVREIIYKKTVTLFEVSFVFGWVFGGGQMQYIDQAKKAAYRLGMAFQIADDLSDMNQDEPHQREINIVKVLGKNRALTSFQNEMALFKEGLNELNIFTPSFEKMCDSLEKSCLKDSGD